VTTLAILALTFLAQEDVAALVRQLGEDALETRDLAEEQLRKRGRAVVPELQKIARDHSDPEVRARAASVVHYLTQVRWQTDLALARKKAAAEKKPLLVFSTMGPVDGYL